MRIFHKDGEFDTTRCVRLQIVKKKIFSAIKKIKQEGTTTLLVTQDIFFAMQVADIIHVLENGKIEIKGTKEELEREPRIRKVYLGI